MDAISNLEQIATRLTPHFTGRNALLDAVQQGFQSGSILSLTQAIKGLGGVGKSQLALKYAYVHSAEYAHIWWIDASTETSILEGYKSFLQAQNIFMDPQSPPQQYIHRVREWLKIHEKWLFIFDNADVFTRDGTSVPPYRVLQDYVPTQQAGTRHILITSRYKNWQPAAKCLDVGVFSADEASEFLCSFTQLPSDTFQQRLAEQLGYLPLALEQAGAYINATGKSYEEYLALFSRYSAPLLARHPDENDPKRIVFTTWNISRDQITNTSALQLLDLLAFFAPDSIEMRWLQEGAEHMPDPLRTDMQDDLTRDALTGELLQYSLVTLQQGKLSLHRLVQRVVRENLDEEACQEAMQCCLSICRGMMFFDFSTPELRSRYRALQPHVLSILDAADDTCFPELRMALYKFLGRGESEHANYDNALQWYGKTQSISETVLGKEHPETATTYNNIAGVYFNKGEHDIALMWHEKALNISEKALGKRHPDTATTYNNIAVVYCRKGEYDIALQWYKKDLSICEKVLGKEHPSTATTYNNIAAVYDSKGEYDIALQWYMCALRIFKTKYGEHPYAKGTWKNMFLTYKKSGKTEDFKHWVTRKLAESSSCNEQITAR